MFDQSTFPFLKGTCTVRPTSYDDCVASNQQELDSNKWSSLRSMPGTVYDGTSTLLNLLATTDKYDGKAHLNFSHHLDD